MICLRSATQHDLARINRIIEAAIMTWNLPERVKRLALPTYRYDEMDLQHLEIVVAEDNDNMVGVAAWEDASAADLPEGLSGLLLHGIYVLPGQWRQGTGQRLFAAAEQAVKNRQKHGLLVKAQQDAEGFYLNMGMQRLPVSDEQRDYANRFWKKLSD
ncbi:MAG: GNAT family N-acetyltransferase [Granulosicoccaceae bacterium]|jgi:GNAT superfamily N-acetyltransferase